MITIRSAKPEDVPQVLPMVKAVSEFHDVRQPLVYGLHPNYLATYGSWLVRQSTEPKSVFLVAEADETHLEGFLIATTEGDIPIYRAEPHGFVHDVWVNEEYRHEGLARQMVMLAIERFSQMGVGQVRLETIHDNLPAQKLFASCGFSPTILAYAIKTPIKPAADSD